MRSFRVLIAFVIVFGVHPLENIYSLFLYQYWVKVADGKKAYKARATCGVILTAHVYKFYTFITVEHTFTFVY